MPLDNKFVVDSSLENWENVMFVGNRWSVINIVES